MPAVAPARLCGKLIGAAGWMLTIRQEISL